MTKSNAIVYESKGKEKVIFHPISCQSFTKRRLCSPGGEVQRGVVLFRYFMAPLKLQLDIFIISRKLIFYSAAPPPNPTLSILGKNSFLSEMVQKGPDGPRRVPNGQKHLG